MKVPFPVSGYTGPSFFCDRVKELKWLEHQMNGSVPAVIIGIRRLGKTGLIQHYFYHLEKTRSGKGIFIDLQGTTSLRELVEKLAEGISTAFSERKYTQVWSLIKALRPVISFDPLSGVPQLGFDFRTENDARNTLKSLLDVVSRQSKMIVLAFDEFQEIATYSNTNMEGLLRSEMQAFPGIRFLFSGSKTHMLTQMFQEGSRPFFGMVQKLYLDKLDRDIYGKFIFRKFRNAGKKISMNQVVDILNWTASHTYYTQYLCNQLFIESVKTMDSHLIDKIKWRILQVSRHDFFQLRDILPTGQWQMVVAIAKEERLYQPTSKLIMDTYKLNTPRAIIKSLKTLLDKQLVYQDFDESGDKYYCLSDVFLMRFIQNYL